MDELYTRDWAEELLELLASAASVETQEQVLFIFNQVANQLADFLGNFNNIRAQIEQLEMRETIVKKYGSQINSSNISDIMTEFDESRTNAKEIALYTKLLQQMTLGYFLLNKIRDTLLEPITYALGFLEGDNLMYIEGVDIETLLEGTLFLSTRINKITERNFARLEIDLTDVIKNLREQGKSKQAKDDPLHNQIMAYTSTHNHTYMTAKGEYRSNPFAGGYLWETYRYMKLNQVDFSEGAVHAIYEKARSGNLIYTKGGDVLSEQDKYGPQVGLTSMATIVREVPLIIEALRSDSAIDIFNKLKAIFIQKLEDSAEKKLKEYVEKDVNKLLNVLKLKDLNANLTF